MNLVKAFKEAVEATYADDTEERAKAITFANIVNIEGLFEARFKTGDGRVQIDDEELELLKEMYKWLRDNGFEITRTCAGVASFVCCATGMSFDELRGL